MDYETVEMMVSVVRYRCGAIGCGTNIGGRGVVGIVAVVG